MAEKSLQLKSDTLQLTPLLFSIFMETIHTSISSDLCFYRDYKMLIHIIEEIYDLDD